MAQARTKSNYLTFMSAICAFAVLTLHTNGCFWDFSATERYWKSANVIECLYYFAVPLFLMMSGITLMDFFDRYSLPEYFRKRVQKTVIPFLAWSLVGVGIQVLLGEAEPSQVTPKYLYQQITGTSAVGIFRFFTLLFTLYLSMPLYAAVEKSKRRTVFTYLVSVGFVLNLLLPFLKSVFSLDLNLPYTLTVASGVLFWPPLGWLLHQNRLKKHQKAGLYALSLLGLLLHMGGTYVLSMRAGAIVQTYKGYQAVPSVLYSTGVFVLLKDIGESVMQRETCRRFFTWLSGYTFPVYLLQFLLLGLCNHLSFVNTRSLLYRLGAPFVMIPILIVMTWCLRKIPVVKRMVP